VRKQESQREDVSAEDGKVEVRVPSARCHQLADFDKQMRWLTIFLWETWSRKPPAQVGIAKGHTRCRIFQCIIALSTYGNST
jgi:hypothetical protein